MNVSKTILFLVILAAVAVIVWVLARDYKDFALEAQQSIDTQQWRSGSGVQPTEAQIAQAKKKKIAEARAQLKTERYHGENTFGIVYYGSSFYGLPRTENEEVAVKAGLLTDKLIEQGADWILAQNISIPYAKLLLNGITDPEQLKQLLQAEIDHQTSERQKWAKINGIIYSVIMGVANTFSYGSLSGHIALANVIDKGIYGDADSQKQAGENFFWSWVNSSIGFGFGQAGGAIKG